MVRREASGPCTLLQEGYSLVQHRFRAVDLQRRVPDNGLTRNPRLRLTISFRSRNQGIPPHNTRPCDVCVVSFENVLPACQDNSLPARNSGFEFHKLSSFFICAARSALPKAL